MPDYTQSAKEILEYFETDPAGGLTNNQARKALEEHGENKIKGKKHLNIFQKFLLQMKDVMVIILIVAAAVSFIVSLVEQSGEYLDSVIIIAIVIINGVLGVRQESQAEKALDALQDMSAPTAKVMRDGTVAQIPSAEVVPGDIILLDAGDFIPADARLIEAASLKCEESALTGESVPVEKDQNAAVIAGAPLGDRRNMVYSGCSVSYGRAKAVVTSTGMNTEMGKIAGLLDNAGGEPTPLQQKLAGLGKNLGIIALAVCALIFVIGIIQKTDIMVMFMTSVSLAVSAIPEGLTAVVTVVLALGVQQMVKRNAIIRKLPAVETLGSASVICSDKTGTLTQNRMTVMKVWAVGAGISDMTAELPVKAKHLVRLGTMCNDGRIEKADGKEKHIGDPTETAIVVAAGICGINKPELDTEYTREAEIPFDSDRKLMTTVHSVNGKYLAVVKGGYDVLLPLCVNTDGSRADEVNLLMAKDALRVLAVACRELDELPQEIMPETLEKDLMFMGLIGMIDPPREESRQAVAECHKAGIKTVMITGDHVTTASAIAKNLGILDGDSQAVSGQELAVMMQEELEKNVDRYRVYARVSPEDKIRIVKAWQSHGEVVAMTGDGVNDAPALKAADIGCAMGITGTDVAKGAADMVLTDDNFSTIVHAVATGRGIYDNIKKTIWFLLGSNLGEIFIVLVAMLLGWGTPLLAIHLLMVNVVTDAFPALALGVEPVEDDVMRRKPMPRNEGVFANGMGVVITLCGVMVGMLSLIAYYIGSFVDVSPLFPHSHEVGMTMTFLTLAISQLVQAFNCRSNRSLFKIGLFSNKSMLAAFLGSLAIVLLVCLVPPLEKIFRMVDLSMAHWLIVAGLSLSPIIIVEIGKLAAGLIGKNHGQSERNVH